MTSKTVELRERIWGGHVPLAIRLAPQDSEKYDGSDTYFVCTMAGL